MLRSLSLCCVALAGLSLSAWAADGHTVEQVAAESGKSAVVDTTDSAELEQAGQAVEPVTSMFPQLWKEAADTQKPPLQLDIYLLVFTLVSFSLFIVTMKSLAWQPLIGGLDERDARVVRAEQSAAKVHHEAERLRLETEAKVAEVHAQVKAMLAEARSAAETRGLEIVARAEAEAQRVKEAALREIDEARRQALGELEGKVSEQALFATSHLLN